MATQVMINSLRECLDHLESALTALGEADDEESSEELIALWWDIKDLSDAVHKQVQKVDPDD